MQAYDYVEPGGWIKLASTIPGALNNDDSIPPDIGYIKSGRMCLGIAAKVGALLDAPHR
jgi:hypothetical protein